MLKIESINGRAYANGYDIEELIKKHEENEKRKRCKESKILADPSVEEWVDKAIPKIKKEKVEIFNM